MLSYRHSYHAGNYADVLKHIVLTLCIEALKEKEKGFLYLDSHSGAGNYLLYGEHAEKTAEYKDGIQKIWQATDYPVELAPYLSLIQAENPDHILKHYPGSPMIAKQLLRTQDKLCLTDLHPTDFNLLKQLFDDDKRAQVSKADGLLQLKAKLPPQTRRGLILVDPSYELKSDYEQVPKSIIEGYKRFATGVYLIWYPVVHRKWVDSMLDILEQSSIKNIQQIEFGIAPDNDQKGMTSSGMIVINAPWKLTSQMQAILPWLQLKLGTKSKSNNILNGHYFIKQLVEE